MRTHPPFYQEALRRIRSDSPRRARREYFSSEIERSVSTEDLASGTTKCPRIHFSPTADDVFYFEKSPLGRVRSSWRATLDSVLKLILAFHLFLNPIPSCQHITKDCSPCPVSLLVDLIFAPSGCSRDSGQSDASQPFFIQRQPFLQYPPSYTERQQLIKPHPVSQQVILPTGGGTPYGFPPIPTFSHLRSPTPPFHFFPQSQAPAPHQHSASLYPSHTFHQPQPSVLDYPPAHGEGGDDRHTDEQKG